MASVDLIEIVAKAIYCDGSYGQTRLGANDDKWMKVNEVQRNFFRQQARAAIAAMKRARNGSGLTAWSALAISKWRTCPPEVLHG